MQQKILIIGLGNPGEKYAGNRHNAGFMVLDRFAKLQNLKWKFEKKFNAEISEFENAIFFKPQTFMNNSGASVGAFVRFYNFENLNILCAHDELDLDFGAVKFKFGGSSGGHNGLKSLDSEISANYLRMRIGIGRGSVDNENKADSVITRVLSDFAKCEQEKLDEILQHCANALECAIKTAQDFELAIQNLEQNSMQNALKNPASSQPKAQNGEILKKLQNLWTKKP